MPAYQFTFLPAITIYGCSAILNKELGAKVYTQPIKREFNGKKFFIGHGDGLGPGDHGYKFIKESFF
jgi:UDP-2,3-diacylglucosamine pyrophosphatase LpxH